MKTKILSLICGVLIGLLLGFPLYACAESITIDDWDYINNHSLTTYLITTKEGVYRVFVFQRGYAGGITAIKIK